MNKDFNELIQRAKLADLEDRPAETVELIRAASVIEPLSAPLRLHLAENLRIIGRFDEASEAFGTLKDTEVPPDTSWLVHLYKGQLYVDLGHFDLGISSFQNAVLGNPTNTGPYIFLASAYARDRKPEKAIEVLLRALEVEGNRDEVFVNLGLNYRTLGNYVLAKDAFTEALKISPDDERTQHRLNDVIGALKVNQQK